MPVARCMRYSKPLHEIQGKCSTSELTHGLAEKGTRVEAVTITPLGVRAPIVESDAMLVIRIALARLRTVPTSKSETL